MTPADHLEFEAEAAMSPAQRPAQQLIDPAIAAQFERHRARRHDAWVRSFEHRPVKKVAEGVAQRGDALLIWIDSNGELRARRVSREDSFYREFVPEYLRRIR